MKAVHETIFNLGERHPYQLGKITGQRPGGQVSGRVGVPPAGFGVSPKTIFRTQGDRWPLRKFFDAGCVEQRAGRPPYPRDTTVALELHYF